MFLCVLDRGGDTSNTLTEVTHGKSKYHANYINEDDILNQM